MNWAEANVHLLSHMAQEIEKDLYSHCYLRVYASINTQSHFPSRRWSGTGDQFFPLHFNPQRAGK
jgi:hypothetical protein